MELLLWGIISPHRRKLNKKAFFVYFVFIFSFCASVNSQDVFKQYFINENEDSGTVIASLSTTDTFIYSSGSVGVEISFNLSALSNGHIITTRKLDREDIDSYYFLFVNINNGKVLKVSIFVNDTNDHFPTFSTDDLTLEISELSDVGSVFSLGSAVDSDLPPFNVQGYNLINGTQSDSQKFNISNTLLTIGNRLVAELVLNQELDREVQAYYNLIIEAFDGGFPIPNTGLLNLHIIVTDSNDNPPVFEHANYNVTVPEDTQLKAVIATVKADDKDAGINGEIKYRIVANSNPNNIFGVEESSGNVFLNKALDAETSLLYHILLEALDGGHEPLVGSTYVTVNVMDINDNQPNINVVFFGENEGQVSEAAEIGENIARVSVSDPDIGEIINVNMVLNGGDDKFEISTEDSVVFILSVKNKLDRENISSYTLSLNATDTSSPPKSTSYLFTVEILDVNDNPPEFEKDLYEVEINENSVPGTFVARLFANDKDLGDNARFQYEMTETQSKNFKIDPNSGVITTTDFLDREATNIHTLVIIARDFGIIQKSSKCEVKVHVGDANDSAPKFNQSSYTFTVDEDAVIGTCFGEVHAYDSDTFAQQSEIIYAWADQNQNQFSISPTSGQICTDSLLNRELEDLYVLEIRATDQANLHSNVNVFISIGDVNDNRPLFDPTIYAINVAAPNTHPGDVILQVFATDEDDVEGLEFGRIFYSVSSGNDDNLFSIDQNTGEIMAASAMPLRNVVRVLRVRATDGGGRTSVVDADVTISILNGTWGKDVEGGPKFSEDEYNLSVQENVDVKTRIPGVSAIAEDGGEVKYILRNDLPVTLWFSLDPQNGDIIVEENIDTEIYPQVTLQILVVSGDPPTYAFSTVHLAITDENDNPPEFVSPTLSTILPYDTNIDTIIYQAATFDADSGSNAQVHYELTSNPSNLFSIDKDSGTLKLKKEFPKTEASYSVAIKATDKGVDPLSSMLFTTVQTLPPTNGCVKFVQAEYEYNIPEDFPLSLSFGNISTSMDSNAQVFELSQDPDAFSFDIFSNGSLYLTKSLDYETREKFHFKVSARSLHKSKFTNPCITTVDIIVNVDDVNDNPPVFEKTMYKFEVQENLNKGLIVGAVIANDFDSGTNGKLMYLLLHENPYFAINSKTGVMTTLQALDRENIAQHSLVAQCRDKSSKPLHTSVVVQINVVDENDNQPLFSHNTNQPFYAVVQADSPDTNLAVAQLYATDVDFGSNGKILFSLENSEAQPFRIDQNTGEIFRKSSLTSSNTYTITVIADDLGTPARQSKATVQIYARSENENPNKLSNTQYAFFLSESDNVGIVLGRFDNPFSTDSRTSRSISPTVYYSIANGNLDGLVDINSSTGELFTTNIIKFEEHPQFDIMVRAEFSGETQDISAQINIIDTNDYPPVFIRGIYHGSVAENAEVNKVVFKVKAEDGDSGVNGIVTYSIVHQHPIDIFTMQPTTGEIRVQHEVDREKFQQSIIVVMATDGGNPPRTSNVTVVMTIRDVNDNPPIFVSRENVFIMEDEKPVYPITYMVAEDDDVGMNALIHYHIVAAWSDKEGNDVADQFDLNQKTGLISLVRELDYEQTTTYFLNISAINIAATPALVSYQMLFIHILDVNDEPPIFNLHQYKVDLQEDADIGHLVTRVTAFDNDSGENGRLVYKLQQELDTFSIESSTGIITTNKLLDRETADQYTITVLVHDSAFPILYDICTVIISVTDVNDNGPRFHAASIHLDEVTSKQIITEINIPESEEGNVVVYKVIATDSDVGRNGKLNYSIIEGNIDGAFSINATTGELWCLKRLDREETPFYKLLIKVEDNGDFPLSAEAFINVNVLDWNDNDPLFTKESYTANVEEGKPVGEYVLTVHANDADEGVNGKIIYSIKYQEVSDDGDYSTGLFSVDELTGAITTRAVLDRERRSTYSFQVEARDCAAYGSRKSTTGVTVNVRDINDNTPVFVKNLIEVNISSVLGANSPLVQVVSHDKDYGMNGTVYYRILNIETSDPNIATTGLFNIDFTTGEITVLRALNRGKYILNVTATDYGTPELSSNAMVVVYVEFSDLNYNSIRFDKAIYSVELDEVVESGLYVTQVRASFHNDQSTKSTSTDVGIIYNFPSGNADGTFDIDSKGEITVKNPSNLDYETLPVIKLIVSAIASSGLSGQMHAYCTVIVNLRDVNDNEPRFLQDRYYSKVWEEQPINTYVLHVTASDDDSGANKDITYYINSGNVHDAFTIDSLTGIVTTAARLDREIREEYKLILHASDNGIPRRTGVCVLKISVVDVNDHKPVLTMPSTLTIPEDEEVGHILTTVTASDLDADPTVTFELASGNESQNEYFSIDKHNGRLSLIETLDYESWQDTVLTIRASDDRFTVEEKIHVTISDVNDNTPQFDQASYQGEVDELKPVGTSVLQVHAGDIDSGDNGLVKYEMLNIMPDTTMFIIDQSTGMITTNSSALFHPQSSVYNIIVQAQDSADVPLSSSVSVQVQIKDINNNQPLFSQPRYTASVIESAEQNKHVINVTATDADFTNENKIVHYMITNGNIDNAFKITTLPSSVREQTIGYITVAGDLDRENIDQYELEITAYDSGKPQMTSTCVIEVEVTDINDNLPHFNQSSYNAFVKEDAKDENVVMIFANDADSSSQLIYKIVAGNPDSAFALTDCEPPRETCALIVAKALDYEKVSEYTLNIQVWDDRNINKAKTTVVPVKIHVQDVNEFQPRFGQWYKEITLTENTEINKELFRVGAVDHDGGIYGNMTYSIIKEDEESDSGCPNSYEIFNINSVTGGVFAIKNLDYEVCGEYSFNVRVDNIGVARTTSKSLKGSNILPVTIFVSSVDEFAPIFVSGRNNNTNTFQFNVPYGSNAGYIVGTVRAVDRDSGEDGKVRYSFAVEQTQFLLNETSGEIELATKLIDATSRILPIIASSRNLKSKAYVTIEVTGTPTIPWEMQVLVIVFGVIAAIALMIVIILCVKHRMAKKQLKDQEQNQASSTQKNGYVEREFYDLNSNSVNASTVRFSQNKSLTSSNKDDQMKTSNQPVTNTVHMRQSSGNSGRSRSTMNGELLGRQASGKVVYRRRRISSSSGRGSEQEDIEVEVITGSSNSRKLSTKSSKNTWNKMPDSGIQPDVDLTELGMKKSPVGSVASMHVFGEEGGGEEPPTMMKMNIQDPTVFSQSSNNTSPGNSIPCTSIASHSRSIDHGGTWSPEFQSIATVFSEIAGQKDEIMNQKRYQQVDNEISNTAVSFRPPVSTRYSYPHAKSNFNHKVPQTTMQAKTKPYQIRLLSNFGNGAPSTNSSQQVGSISSLPQTPISHDSSFTSLAISPNLSLSLTPLATRSPSISPMTFGGEAGFSSSDGISSKTYDKIRHTNITNKHRNRQSMN